MTSTPNKQRPESFVSVVSPLWLLCQMFGLHVDVSYATHDAAKPNARSYLNVLSVCLLRAYAVCLLLLNSIYFWTIVNVKFDQKINIIIQVADMIVMYSNMTLMAVNVVNNVARRSILRETFVDLLDVERLMRTFHAKTSTYKNLRLFVYAQIAFTLATWLAFLLYYVLALCPLVDTRGSCFVRFLTFNWPTLVSQLHALQFCTYVVIVRTYYQVLNDALTELKVNKVTMVFISGGDVGNDVRCKNLNRIQVAHRRLCVIGERLNAAYGIPLLVMFGNGFVVIFSSIYFSIFGYIVDSRMSDPKNPVEVILPIFTLTFPLVKVVTVAVQCDFATRDSCATGALLYKVSVASHEHRLTFAIKEFSLQLLHQTFSIDACGFFIIDCSLLQMIVGGVSTYLIILIQFDLAIPNPEAKENTTVTVRP